VFISAARSPSGGASTAEQAPAPNHAVGLKIGVASNLYRAPVPRRSESRKLCIIRLASMLFA
jgi:hypothetical protein